LAEIGIALDGVQRAEHGMDSIRVMGIFFQLGNAIGSNFILVVKIFPEIRDDFVIHGNFDIQVCHTVCDLCVNFTGSADRDALTDVTFDIQNHALTCYYIGLLANFFISESILRICGNYIKMLNNSKLSASWRTPWNASPSGQANRNQQRGDPVATRCVAVRSPLLVCGTIGVIPDSIHRLRFIAGFLQFIWVRCKNTFMGAATHRQWDLPCRFRQTPLSP
jgi:hypothetical protein